MNKPIPLLSALLVASTLFGASSHAQQAAQSKPATPVTVRANDAAAKAMTMNDKQDFEDATRGLMAQLKDPLVKAADGRGVWDTQRYDFVKGDAPATVNPSLWREQKLNTAAGLFKVVDGIYQIRGYDLANITLVEGATGWIVIDTLLTEDTARAGMKLAMETLKSTKPVVAVIYTHSHADHFGGVRGVVDEADVRSGKVKVIAPEGFMDNAVAENVLAGNAMTRRANYSVRTLDAGQRRGLGPQRPRQGVEPRCARAGATDGDGPEDRRGDAPRRRAHRVPDGAGLGGAVGNDDVLPRQEGAVPVGGRNQADAQRLHHPRREGA